MITLKVRALVRLLTGRAASRVAPSRGASTHYAQPGRCDVSPGWRNRCDDRRVAVTIREARDRDSAALQTLERLAGARFRDVGLASVADDEPLPAETLARYAAEGRGWVAVSPDDEPIGYVIVDLVDGNAHVEQVSVHPDHQGAGIGRALLDRVRAWAIEMGAPRITLTTFNDVPWNRPLYEHLGFVVIDDDSIGPGLKDVCRAEVAHGLDPERRVCMAFDLGS